MFSLTFKASVMFIFLLFVRNFYVILALGEVPKNSIHRDLFKTKTLNNKSADPQLRFSAFYALWWVDRLKA